MNDSMGGLAAAMAAIDQRLAQLERLTAEIRQLVGPFGVPIGPNELMVQTLHGTKYIVQADDLIMTPNLVVYRQWEDKLSQLLLHFAGEGGVFVDVGANFGYFTCLCGQRMGGLPGASIIAVEPGPRSLDLLRRNVTINWSMAPIQIVPMGLAATTGTRQLFVPKTRAANSSFAAGAAEGQGEMEPFAVETTTLDLLLADQAEIAFIKVDVEGFETEVFRGARQTLLRPRAPRIVFEWSLPQLAAGGFDPQELPALLAGAGYRFFDAERYLQDGEGAALAEGALPAVPYMNVLALRP
jgi:FkbM family methyltransferase